MEMIILSGIPGCGKTTYAMGLLAKRGGLNQICISADNYFYGQEGYKFDPAKLGEAHAYCLKAAIAYASGNGVFAPPAELLIIDNTNLSVAEIAPYYAIGEAYGYQVKILRWTKGNDPAKTLARNVHNVPRDKLDYLIEKQKRLSAEMPPRWKVEWIESDV